MQQPAPAAAAAPAGSRRVSSAGCCRALVVARIHPQQRRQCSCHLVLNTRRLTGSLVRAAGGALLPLLCSSTCASVTRCLDRSARCLMSKSRGCRAPLQQQLLRQGRAATVPGAAATHVSSSSSSPGTCLTASARPPLLRRPKSPSNSSRVSSCELQCDRRARRQQAQAAGVVRCHRWRKWKIHGCNVLIAGAVLLS